MRVSLIYLFIPTLIHSVFLSRRGTGDVGLYPVLFAVNLRLMISDHTFLSDYISGDQKNGLITSLFCSSHVA